MPRPARRETLEEALKATNEQYGETLKKLAAVEAEEKAEQAELEELYKKFYIR